MQDDLHAEHAFRLLISVVLDWETLGIIGWALFIAACEVAGMCLLEKLTTP